MALANSGFTKTALVITISETVDGTGGEEVAKKSNADDDSEDKDNIEGSAADILQRLKPVGF